MKAAGSENTILVVEDDAGLAYLIAEVLGGHDWKIVRFGMGEDALAWLAGAQPELVLLDYSLPDMTGVKFIDRCIPMPPFIVATGMGDERIAVDVMKRGARDYIVKDSHFLELLPIAVKRTLEQIATERSLARAQQDLKESAMQLQIATRAAHVGLWDWNLRTNTVYYSPEWKHQIGCEDDEISNNFSEWESRVHPEDLDNALKTIRAFIDKPWPDYHLEFRFRHKNGSYRWIMTQASILYDEQGKPARMVGSHVEVTDRKREEEERLELERRLLHAQKLESLGLLAGGIAHDFNNLLLGVLGNLELAISDLSSAADARSSIEHAMNAALRAADLTRQMLAYSGKGAFLVKNLDISDLVRENSDLLRASTPKSVTLHLNLTRGIPPIKADAAQMQQVIMNLITNACEAMCDKSGIIRVSTGVKDHDDATLSRSRLSKRPPAGEYVYLEVADTGCGMDEATQERIFDPFFTTKMTGRGLGMSAVLGIVGGHKGAILVESALGLGTTIRILFPIAQTIPEKSSPG